MYTRSVLAVLWITTWTHFGCGPRSAPPVNTLEGRVVGELVRIEGRLSTHGSTPFPTLVLELDDGTTVILKSRTVEEDLRRLADMRVAVEGEVSQPMRERRVLDVLRYELVRLPSGELPLIGVISLDGQRCILTTGRLQRYWLRGDLVPVLSDYAGSRVWVTGSFGSSATAPGGGATSYWVQGYGILREAD